MFSGLSFAFCGDVVQWEVELKITKNGGTISEFSNGGEIRKCDFMISTSSSRTFLKYKQAQEYEIPIVTRNYIDFCIKKCRVVTDHPAFYLYNPARSKQVQFRFNYDAFDECEFVQPSFELGGHNSLVQAIQ